MDIFEQILLSFEVIPPWVTLAALPAAFLVYALLTAFLGGRRSYPFVLCAGCALEAVFAIAHGAAASVFAGGAFALYAAILRLLYLLPRRPSARKKRMPALERSELSSVPVRPAPPAYCAYEDVSRMTAAERGMKLSHAEELLARLRRASLTAPDRLETEVLERTLSGSCAHALSEEELLCLTDSLTSLLKLCAKYRV